MSARKGSSGRAPDRSARAGVDPAPVAARPSPAPPSAPAVPLAPVPPARRLAAALATWALLYLSTPGLLRPDGFGHVAFVALVPWALVCSRPGRRAFLVEWLAAGIGLVAIVVWLRYVVPFVLPAIGAVTGLYVAFAGVVLRRLARRMPLALAVPLAWMVGELPRFLLPVPLSFGWWRLGTMAHDTGWLAGSARVLGVFALSFVFAAFAGMAADLWRAYRTPRGASPPVAPARAAALGLAPLALVVALSFATSPPATEPGPRVLVVTPGIHQEVKAFHEDPFVELYGSALSLTREALAAGRAAGEPPPDLVAWGETMLWFPTVEEGWLEAFHAGARPPAWIGDGFDESAARWTAVGEAIGVQAGLYGRRELLPPSFAARFARVDEPWARAVLAGERILPPGTSFVAGNEHHVARAGELRRLNAIAIWDARGERTGLAAKVHLVPAAEDASVAASFPPVIDAIRAAGGYVPNFVPAERTGVLALEGADGRSWAFGATVCYDNVFDDPYTEPLRRTALDFHLVASNEAWYRTSPEMDHMVAFSRLIAIMTGRSFVRATNSGASIVIGPDGRDVAVLEVGGERKMVRGALLAEVPVPSADPAPVTFYVRTEPVQLGLWALLVLGSVVLAFRSVTPTGQAVRTAPRRA